MKWQLPFLLTLGALVAPRLLGCSGATPERGGPRGRAQLADIEIGPNDPPPPPSGEPEIDPNDPPPDDPEIDPNEPEPECEYEELSCDDPPACSLEPASERAAAEGNRDGGSCACVQTTVRCGKKPPNCPADAMYDRKPCAGGNPGVMYLSESACKKLGYTNNQTIDTPRSFDPEGLPSDLSKTGAVDKARAYCLGAHELVGHGCKSSATSCQEEQGAYSLQIDCLNAAKDRHDCANKPNVGSCKEMDKSIASADLNRRMNSCLCRPDSTCEGCFQECQQATNKPQACQKSALTYCALSGKGP